MLYTVITLSVLLVAAVATAIAMLYKYVTVRDGNEWELDIATEHIQSLNQEIEACKRELHHTEAALNAKDEAHELIIQMLFSEMDKTPEPEQPTQPALDIEWDFNDYPVTFEDTERPAIDVQPPISFVETKDHQTTSAFVSQDTVTVTHGGEVVEEAVVYFRGHTPVTQTPDLEESMIRKNLQKFLDETYPDKAEETTVLDLDAAPHKHRSAR